MHINVVHINGSLRSRVWPIKFNCKKKSSKYKRKHSYGAIKASISWFTINTFYANETNQFKGLVQKKTSTFSKLIIFFYLLYYSFHQTSDPDNSWNTAQSFIGGSGTFWINHMILILIGLIRHRTLWDFFSANNTYTIQYTQYKKYFNNTENNLNVNSQTNWAD